MCSWNEALRCRVEYPVNSWTTCVVLIHWSFRKEAVEKKSVWFTAHAHLGVCTSVYLHNTAGLHPALSGLKTDLMIGFHHPWMSRNLKALAYHTSCLDTDSWIWALGAVRHFPWSTGKQRSGSRACYCGVFLIIPDLALLLQTKGCFNLKHVIILNIFYQSFEYL